MRADIWATLARVAESGVSIIVVDKNIADLFAIASRCIVLVKGEAVFNGASATLRRDEEAVHRWLGV